MFFFFFILCPNSLHALIALISFFCNSMWLKLFIVKLCSLSAHSMKYLMARANYINTEQIAKIDYFTRFPELKAWQCCHLCHAQWKASICKQNDARQDMVSLSSTVQNVIQNSSTVFAMHNISWMYHDVLICSLHFSARSEIYFITNVPISILCQEVFWVIRRIY